MWKGVSDMKRREQDIYAEEFRKLTSVIEDNTKISSDAYNDYKVKRGLRNSDGTGVLAGLTRVGQVHGYIMYEDEKIPDEGKLTYRGIDVADIVSACENENRFGYEETCYLLLFGKLPTKAELDEFKKLLGNLRALPDGFREEVIMYSPSNNIMNKLARSVLAMYSYDNDPDSIDLYNLLRQSILLLSQVPTMVAYAFEAKKHYFDGKSLIIHNPIPEYSTAENILHMIRPDNKFTDLEAKVLDLALILHAEHGGGNNSAFTTRVISSSNSDTYSAVSAAIGSLKGPKHGGANCRVVEMIEDFKANLTDINDKDQVANHIGKLLKRETFDKSGLVYGMGHAVYTKSDPRAVALKKKAEELAYVTGKSEEFKLYNMIEELTPEIFEKYKGRKTMCANVDLYSGFVYSCLNIPTELFTPLFAVARMPGWCAHRIEEIVYDGKIIRPAYKSVCKTTEYTPIDKR